MKKTRSFPLLVLLIFTILSCRFSTPATPTTLPTRPAAVSQTKSDTIWPGEDWLTTSPESQGIASAQLDAMLAEIEAQNIQLYSLLIIRNGFIVSETYYPPFTINSHFELYSVTKSFTSSLVGITIDQGKMTLDDPVLDYFSDRKFDNMDPRKQAMRINHLLSMTSGLDWAEGDATYRAMYISADWVQYVLDLPMATEPGDEFLYCSGCSHLLSAAVQTATGENPADYAETYLFEPIGIRDYTWDVDSQGLPIGGWGLHITPRDMARLGYLYLHNGEWDGRQVISAEWVADATRKHADTDGGGYGYQWWLLPGLGGYAAMGLYGQTIFVQPELNLIVVTTARLNDHGPIIQLISDYILPATR